jgi:hypothetical protein
MDDAVSYRRERSASSAFITIHLCDQLAGSDGVGHRILRERAPGGCIVSRSAPGRERQEDAAPAA